MRAISADGRTDASAPVSIHADSGGSHGARLHNLTSPKNLDADVDVFTAAAGFVLDADTTYWIGVLGGEYLIEVDSPVASVKPYTLGVYEADPETDRVEEGPTPAPGGSYSGSLFVHHDFDGDTDSAAQTPMTSSTARMTSRCMRSTAAPRRS